MRYRLPFYNAKEERVFTAEEFDATMEEKHGRSNFRGMEILNDMNVRDNAPGDVSQVAMAYQYATDRLTYIRARYVEQTFYEVPPADFMDVLVGEGAWSAQIVTQLSFKASGSFKQGKAGTATGNAKIPVADALIAPQYTKIMNWNVATEYTLIDVNQALFTGTWDPIEAKQKARKKDYDLGIQEIAFIGDTSDEADYPGLLTIPTVTTNVSRISQAISSFSTTQFQTFVANVIGDFLATCAYTTFPNKFVIPTDDWAGLGVPVSPTFPNITMLDYLQKAFDAICTKGLKMVPCAYGIPANNLNAINVGTGKHCYVLYHEDIDTLFMELPVPYTVTQVGTYNNYQFQDVAYCQYSGVTVLKPLEMLYYQF